VSYGLVYSIERQRDGYNININGVAMNTLSSVIVKGFWGDRDIHVSLKGGVSILIGVNGSGKTTLLDIISGVLLVDVDRLKMREFSSVDLCFECDDKKRNFNIFVEKVQDKYNITFLRYAFSGERWKRPKKYSVILDDRSSRYALGFSVDKRARDDVVGCIRDNVGSVRWIDTWRGIVEEYDEHRTSVDAKVDAFLSMFQVYNNKLARMENRCLEILQRKMIEASVSSPDFSDFISHVHDLDFKSLCADFGEMCAKVVIDVSAVRRIRELTSALRATRDRLNAASGKGGDSVAKDAAEYVFTLYNVYVAHKIVEEWRKSSVEIENIYAARNCFIDTVNELLVGKKVFIADDSSLRMETSRGKRLGVSVMSSGEKQLLILLGDALLSHGFETVYMADEPEISLHIKWQEVLIDCIRRVNGNCQVVFATHSPDIVSNYQGSVVDMSKVVGNV